jgi:deoxyribodipyrimidine photo-lyase
MTERASVPALRIESLNEQPVRHEGAFVLYWMTAFRRLHWNFALQRAVEWSRRLDKPLVVLEALRCDYRWASDRHHAFVLQGMADNAAHAASRPLLYYPYVEPERGAGKGLLAALATHASVIVADHYPAFFLPHMVTAAAARVPVRFERVDSNGLLPLNATDRVFTSAFSFRAFLHKELKPHLTEFLLADPLARVELPRLKSLPDRIEQRWPRASASLLTATPKALAALPIDHTVAPVAAAGGESAARLLLKEFVKDRLDLYLDRNDPEVNAASGLSPYLHWGHVSAHEIADAVARKESWTVEKLADKGGGHREGWWGMSPAAEGFLDELVTWREIGFNMSAKRTDATAFSSLPAWARATLQAHTADERPALYSLAELESARTGDDIWNAAQRQLVRDGVIHNCLRMLWGKRVLEWTRTPEEAYEILEHLNNKYAIDGRDPNSYSGILWIFGRYDRPWGPERPIYGQVRYMSSENTRKKLHLKQYLTTFGQTEAQLALGVATPASAERGPGRRRS